MGFLRLAGTIRGIRSRLKTMAHCNGCIQKRVFSGGSGGIDGEDSVLPVMIVGAGPVGLTLAILLTRLGIKCAILEKNTGFSRHPQAHFINNRSMEVFRKIDALADEILRHQPLVDTWRKFIYCKSLVGPIFGLVDHMRPEDFDHSWSPVSVAHFSQYKLMRLLLKQLENIGFSVRSDYSLSSGDCKHLGLKILLGHECVSISDSKDAVSVTTRLTEAGRQVEKEFKCKFVVGTDGSASMVRKLMGIGMSGERNLQNLISVHFTSHDLGQYLMNERPGMLFFVFNTEAIGVLVAHDLTEGEFVLQLPFYPPQQEFEDFSHKACKELVFKLAGRELADVNVLDIKPWVMHAEVAERFSAFDNRVILAGDAAHRFPPAGGFGMNTGIQDAHNLAWKLASILKGTTSPSFLSTYETERRQIALFNTALSVQNFHAAMAIPAALGLDPKIANSMHRTVNNVLGAVLPTKLQKTVLDGIFRIGRMQLSDSLLNESNPVGSSRLENLRRVFEEGKSLQLQFPAEDLGFRYSSGALVPETDGSSSSSSEELPSGRRKDYIPSSLPGARLPHMEIQLLSPHLPNTNTFSTHDLSSLDKIEFLLLIAPTTESYKLAQAAFKVAEEHNVSLKVCVIWQRNATANGQSEAALSPWTNFVDVVEARNRPTADSWWDICGIADKGAILVRPDDHIAWRAKSEIRDDPVLLFKQVFRDVLRLSP